MKLDAAIQERFELMVREPLEETPALRRALAARAQAVRAAPPDLLDLRDFNRAVKALEDMLAPISRKTTPLHHRLIHTTTRWFLRPADNEPLSAARLNADIAVINECARVIRRPELVVLL